MTVRIYDSYGNTRGGEFIAIPSGFDFTAASLGETDGFETFCLERNEWIWPGRPYEVEISKAAIRGGYDGGSPDPLDPMTAYLYHHFITRSLANYDYENTGVGRANIDDALQYAIWYIEDEITTLPSTLSTVFYNDAYDAVYVSQRWEGTGNVYVMNLYRTNWRGHKYNRQDQLVMIIPAPNALLLSAIGIALIGWLRKNIVPIGDKK